MNNADYPALWRSGDAASRTRQKTFLVLVRIHLSLLAATGLIAAWNPTDPLHEKIVSWSVAGTMLVALIVSFAIKQLKLDDAWFRTRAFAENAKEAAWRYMMHPPSAPDAGADPVRSAYLDTLQKIRERFPGLAKEIAAEGDTGAEITQRMQDVRAMSIADRCKLYLNDRIQDQLDWYASKAKVNAKAETRWFWFILAAEGTAVLAAIIRLTLVQEFNPTGGIAAMAACLVAWLQTKRFSDLANTYAVAALDLKMIKERYGQATTEETLFKLVDEAEAAISREHRLWVEKRIGTA
ncbi:MAG: SLATT domain-containing protein [Phycisphaerales bacterium]